MYPINYPVYAVSTRYIVYFLYINIYIMLYTYAFGIAASMPVNINDEAMTYP